MRGNVTDSIKLTFANISEKPAASIFGTEHWTLKMEALYLVET